MACIISSKEDLARELASRGVSPFIDATNGDTSYSLIYLPLFLGTIFLIIHIAVFFDVYAVQLSRVTGNYAETEATLVNWSYRVSTHRNHSKHGFSSTTRERHYYTKAVSDDGTEFNFSGTIDYGREGSRLKIKYSKGNPHHAYVDVDLLDMLLDKPKGVSMLVFSVLAFWVARAVYKRGRKNRDVLARDLYLPVRESSRYETKTVRTKKSSYKKYAPIYRYAMPDGADLLFRGRWSRNKPEGEPANDNKDFRVYMMDPEDPKNNEYFIKEIPHQFEGLEGFS